MIKELIARVIQPTENTNTSESPEPDDIHEKIRKGVLKLLSNVGYSNLTVTVGPPGGCPHLHCHIDVDTHWENIDRSIIDETCEVWKQCVHNAFLMILNEVIGNREIVEENYKFNVTDYKGK
jgi:hypothetical protein